MGTARQTRASFELTRLLGVEESRPARSSPISADGTARGRDKSDAGRTRDLRSRSRALGPKVELANVWHQMRNYTGRLICAPNSTVWGVHHQDSSVGTSCQSKACSAYQEPPSQRASGPTNHHPILSPLGC